MKTKYGVEAPPKDMEKCPRCGGPITIHGRVAWCEKCGTDPFEVDDGEEKTAKPRK